MSYDFKLTDFEPTETQRRIINQFIDFEQSDRIYDATGLAPPLQASHHAPLIFMTARQSGRRAALVDATRQAIARQPAEAEADQPADLPAAIEVAEVKPESR